MTVPLPPRRIATALVACAITIAFLPATASAQRRGHPVRGGGRGGAVVVSSPVFFGYGFYDPFWGPAWGPGWGYPGWYPPYGPQFAGRDDASARLHITPKQAEVYVDGYLAGQVDDFDGFFQRLDVPAGEHELTFYLDGYETLTHKVVFQSGKTLEISQDLRKLAAGESSGPRPQAAAPRPDAQGDPGPPAGPPPGTRGRRNGPWGPPMGPARGPDAGPGPGGAPAANFGTLAVRVQPGDATLLVDGEEWDAPEGPGAILIDLAEGPHDVEIRKDGMRPYRRTIDIRAGRTVPLNVSLSR